MGAALAHRGPDGGTEWADPSGGPVLAHRRLAVIDTSANGDQPMASRSGRWVVIFNGEIYNHHSLRDALARSRPDYRGHGDTATLVEAIDAWGVEATLVRINGMFAFAAWDTLERRLFLARDRLGEKPLYWAHSGGTFAFASELKALRAVPGMDLQIDPAAVHSVLRWSFVPSPSTVYRGVRQLRPGHLLEVRQSPSGHVVDEREWWSPREAITGRAAARTVHEAAEELRPLLADAVALRLESDVPLGSFLSGGIDSTTVAAFAQQALGGTLHTFTVAMPEFGFDESAHAAAVARHLGTHHSVVELSAAEALAAVPTLADVWDEPFADPSMLPSLLLCRAARRQLTVCLAGDGGDEVFAGYNRHALGAALWRRARHVPRPIRTAAGSALLAPKPSTVDRVGAAASRVLPARLRLPNMGDKFQKAAAVLRADTDGLWASLAQIWPAASLPGPGGPAPTATAALALDPVEQMMLTDTAVVLPDQMLVKVDRASMAASLEVRSPFLDHRLLEWSWRQPVDVLTRGGVGKLVLREVLRGMVPPEITDRPKMGFDPPLATWLRGPLRDWAGDLLHDSTLVRNGWLDGAALRATWAEHQDGRRNHDYRLWAALMAESWLCRAEGRERAELAK